MNQITGEEKRKKRTGLSFHIDPFELLYVAISIATFSHTVWASSFAFEGPPPSDMNEMLIWQLKGSLIAIAIDLGMLLSARFIAKSNTINRSMVVAFIVAAISSFYTQLLYILYHTSAFNISSGVDSYWTTSLTPLVSARVIILPILLPFLGIIYTLARVGREKQAAKEEATRKASEPIRVSDVLKTYDGQRQLENGSLNALPSPNEDLIFDDRIQQAIDILGNAQVDLENFRFYDVHWEAWSKPYESREAMIKGMIMLGKRRKTMANNRSKKSPKSDS